MKKPKDKPGWYVVTAYEDDKVLFRERVRAINQIDACLVAGAKVRATPNANLVARATDMEAVWEKP